MASRDGTVPEPWNAESAKARQYLAAFNRLPDHIKSLFYNALSSPDKTELTELKAKLRGDAYKKYENEATQILDGLSEDRYGLNGPNGPSVAAQILMQMKHGGRSRRRRRSKRTRRR